ncbi:MAG: (2Fe-2S)-binding protein [Desulfurococcaceae archaeon]
MSRIHEVKLTINGKEYRLSVASNERLIDTLRYKVGLTSVKEGCGRGECGNCIVLVNDKPRYSCLTLTSTIDGSEITTLEGIAPEGMLHAIQVGFIESGGVQCGFCVPGFIIVAKSLLDHNPDPSIEEIKQWLASVLCRCGSYYHYIKAVKQAAEYLKRGRVFFSIKEVKERMYSPS